MRARLAGCVHLLPCPPPPPAWRRLAAAAAARGVEGVREALSAELLVLPGEGRGGCFLARRGWVHTPREPSLSSFLAALFLAAADPSARRAAPGLAAAPPPALSRHDLFHGHIFLAGGGGGGGEDACWDGPAINAARGAPGGARGNPEVASGSGVGPGLGVLFHACEYPRFDPLEFPYDLGFCQRGSGLDYDARAMDLRNIVYYEGRLAVLDVGAGGALHAPLLHEGTRPLRTVYEDDLGPGLGDVLFLPAPGWAPPWEGGGGGAEGKGGGGGSGWMYGLGAEGGGAFAGGGSGGGTGPGRMRRSARHKGGTRLVGWALAVLLLAAAAAPAAEAQLLWGKARSRGGDAAAGGAAPAAQGEGAPAPAPTPRPAGGGHYEDSGVDYSEDAAASGPAHTYTDEYEYGEEYVPAPAAPPAPPAGGAQHQPMRVGPMGGQAMRGGGGGQMLGGGGGGQPVGAGGQLLGGSQAWGSGGPQSPLITPLGSSAFAQPYGMAGQQSASQPYTPAFGGQAAALQQLAGGMGPVINSPGLITPLGEEPRAPLVAPAGEAPPDDMAQGITVQPLDTDSSGGSGADGTDGSADGGDAYGDDGEQQQGVLVQPLGGSVQTLQASRGSLLMPLGGSQRRAPQPAPSGPDARGAAAPRAPAAAARPPPPPATVARISIPSSPGGGAAVRARSGELTPVTFDGSNSSNADAYMWTVSQIRPTTQLVDLGLPFPEPSSFEALLGSGEYLVMLRVAGPYGTHTQQTLVTVQKNSIPVANAGGPYTGYVGRAVAVSAGRSADADKDPLRFRWTLALAGSDDVLAEVFDVDTTFTVNRVGEYVLTLEADDGRGGVSATQTDLLVLPASYAPADGGRGAGGGGGGARGGAAAALPSTVVVGRPAGSWDAEHERERERAQREEDARRASLLAAAAVPAPLPPPPQQQQPALAPAPYPQMSRQPVVYPSQMGQQQQQQQIGSYPQQGGYQQPGGYPQQQGGRLQAPLMPQQQAPQARAGGAGAAPYGTIRPAGGYGGGGGALPQYQAGQQQYAGQGDYHTTATPQGAPAALDPATLAASAAAAAAGAVYPILPGGAPPGGPGFPGQAAAPAAGAGGPLVRAAGGGGGVAAAASPAAPNRPNQNVAPQCLFDKATGVGIYAYDILAMPPLTNLAAWSNQEWRDCTSGPVKPVGAAAGATAGGAGGGAPGALGVLSAVIAAPANVVSTGGNHTGRVPLDAAGSQQAPLRPILMYSWLIKRLPDGEQVAATGGKQTSVWLPTGVYAVTLTVTDLMGSAASASKVFAVWPVTATTAVIRSPPDFVQAEGETTQFLMSGNGTLPAPGRNLTMFAWRVASVPDGRVVASVAGYAGHLRLPTGKYSIQMVAVDSGRGNDTAAKEFVIGSSSDPRNPNWNETAIAAISLPAPAVPQATGSGLTRVALDAAGSSPAGGARLTSVLWAVVALPGRAAAANASGAAAEVWLPPGDYQVGLLISDSAGNTATARKAFAIVPPSPKPAAGAAADLVTAAGVGLPEGPAPNAPPVIPPGLSYEVAPGRDGLAIAGVTDADGDEVELRWTLMEDATGKMTTGSGAKVKLPPGAAAGGYQLLITADDGRGGVSEAVARVAVHGPDAPAPASAAGGGGGRGGADAASTAAPSIYGSPLAAAPRLPALTFYQGATLDADAAASGLFDLSRPDWRETLAAATCEWTLAAAGGGGGGAAKVYGCGAPARFRLGTPGAFVLTLEVTGGAGGAASKVETQITVTPKPRWGDHYNPVSLNGFAAGRCGDGHFSGLEFTPLELACGGVSLPAGWGAERGLGAAEVAAASRRLEFSWRLTPLTPRAAAAHAAPLARASAGAGAAAFGPAAPGLYQAEVVGAAGGAGGGAPSSVHTVYYLSTLLLVAPATNLSLPLPPTSCAGIPIRLAPAPLALLPGQAAAPAQWEVSWIDAPAATGAPLVLTGSGGSFTFPTQPGKYDAAVWVDVTDAGAGGPPRRLAAVDTVTARPCFRCSGRPVALAAAPDTCRARPGDAVKLMDAAPAWLSAARVAFAPGADVSVGRRAVAITARSLVSNVTTRCSVPDVTIADDAPPSAAPKHAGGECVAPSNGKWACWPLPELVAAADGCAGARPLQFQASCGDADGCRVAADGRVCVKADARGGASRALTVSVLLRDANGNTTPEPVRVPVTVHRDARPGCALARLDAAP
ncbi:MAG: hypothetical protein J3K34DRAFT_519556 [Monoraphidium minutum]|nr:MAG: hypothetical protein J3K34DRAFT_519556 [Monoraphidium minutum]